MVRFSEDDSTQDAAATTAHGVAMAHRLVAGQPSYVVLALLLRPWHTGWLLVRLVFNSAFIFTYLGVLTVSIILETRCVQCQ